MARKRVISPEIWTSEDFLHLSYKGRLLYISLMNHANDQGMFKYSLITIKASCFPADNVTKQELADQLSIMLKRGMLVLNDDGTLLRFKKWDDWQKVPKPAPNKYEFVEGLLERSDTTTESLLECSDTSKVRVSPKIKKIREDKEDKIIEDKAQIIKTQFEDIFWIGYIKHRKKDKQEALKAWIKLTDAERTIAIDQLPHHVAYWQAQIDNGSMQIIHVPYPVRWLRRKSYNDPLDTLVITPSKSAGKKEVFDSTYHDNMVKQTKAHRAYMEKMEKDKANNDEIKEALTRRLKG